MSLAPSARQTVELKKPRPLWKPPQFGVASHAALSFATHWGESGYRPPWPSVLGHSLSGGSPAGVGMYPAGGA